MLAPARGSWLVSQSLKRYARVGLTLELPVNRTRPLVVSRDSFDLGETLLQVLSNTNVRVALADVVCVGNVLDIRGAGPINQVRLVGCLQNLVVVGTLRPDHSVGVIHRVSDCPGQARHDETIVVSALLFRCDVDVHLRSICIWGGGGGTRQ